MTKKLLTIAAIAGGVLGAMTLLPGCSVFGVRDTPAPDYKVLQSYGSPDVEIRQYDEMIVAKATVKGSYEDSRDSFRVLADYIFGKNKSKEEIGMTAPVFQQEKQSDQDTTRDDGENIGMTAPVFQEKSEQGWQMSFVMPSRYTMETIPKPVDPRVKLEKVPPKKVAVLRFSGRMSSEKMQDKISQLKKWLEHSPYEAISGYRTAGYDPPFTLPFFRRNEVLVEVKAKSK